MVALVKSTSIFKLRENAFDSDHKCIIGQVLTHLLIITKNRNIIYEMLSKITVKYETVYLILSKDKKLNIKPT